MGTVIHKRGCRLLEPRYSDPTLQTIPCSFGYNPLSSRCPFPFTLPTVPCSLVLKSVPDAILVVCGDHFGLIVDRSPELLEKGPLGDDSGSLVGLVDDAIARGDRQKAVEFLSLEASHGRVSGREGTI